MKYVINYLKEIESNRTVLCELTKFLNSRQDEISVELTAIQNSVAALLKCQEDTEVLLAAFFLQTTELVGKVERADYMLSVWPRLVAAKSLTALTATIEPGDCFCTPIPDDSNKTEFVYFLDAAAGLYLYKDGAGTVPIGEALGEKLLNSSIMYSTLHSGTKHLNGLKAEKSMTQKDFFWIRNALDNP